MKQMSTPDFYRKISLNILVNFQYPYEIFSFLYGQGPLDALGCHRLPPDRVDLTLSLLGR